MQVVGVLEEEETAVKPLEQERQLLLLKHSEQPVGHLKQV